jgi:hypothetical protein
MLAKAWKSDITILSAGDTAAGKIKKERLKKWTS